MFITFEGIDGSGKSTQLQRAAQAIRATGQKVLLTREPGGTELAEKLRLLLLETTIDSAAELLLFGAARAQHVAEVIRPALEAGTAVLCDRFTDSSLAYQGGGLNLSAEFIGAMNRFATNDLEPDLTLLLDIDPLAGKQRQQHGNQHPDAIEVRGLEFLKRVRQSYLQLAQAEPKRFVLINAARPADVVQKEINRILQNRFLISHNQH